MELEEYVAARGQALVRLGFLLTGDAHSAQDLAQTALVKCLGRWDRISRLDDDAIAETLGVSRSTVRSTASRGAAHARAAWDVAQGEATSGSSERKGPS